MTDLRIDPAAELRRAALELFARDGYDATSLQDVADRVGYTKANVLYHFGSKQGLLEAALAPAIEVFEGLATAVAAGDLDAQEGAGVEPMLDFLFEHEHAVSIFVNQASSLREHRMVQRATELIALCSTPGFEGGDEGVRALRINIAITGAAYVVAQRHRADLYSAVSDEEFRQRLLAAVQSITRIDDARPTEPAGGEPGPEGKGR